MIALQQCDLIDAKFNGLLHEPFDPVGIFGRRDANMYSEIFFAVWHRTMNVESTLVGIRVCYDPLIEDAFSVGKSYQVAVSFSKNLNSMPRLVRIQVQGTLGD